MKHRSAFVTGAVLACLAGPAASAELDNSAPDDTSAGRVIYVTAFEADSVLRFDTLTGGFLGSFRIARKRRLEWADRPHVRTGWTSRLRPASPSPAVS